MRKQLVEENLFVVNKDGKEVRFDLELMENKFGNQFAIATERADTEAPLRSAREEVGQDLKAIDGIRLNDLTYCERDPKAQGVETMNFKEAPHLGPERLELDGRVQFLSENSFRGTIETASPGIGFSQRDQGAEQQSEQVEQMRNTPLPPIEPEHER